MPTPGAVSVVIFAATVLIIGLHIAEWVNIVSIPKTLASKTRMKVSLLQVSVGVETAYYFLLLVAYVAFYPNNFLFLTLLATLGLIHLAAFWSIMGKNTELWLGRLTNRRIGGVVVFDFLEIVVLVALAFEFRPWV